MVQGELFSDDVTEVNAEKVDTDGIKQAQIILASKKIDDKDDPRFMITEFK